MALNLTGVTISGTRLFNDTAPPPSFSATAYTGNATARTITTNVDNTGESAVWIKARSSFSAGPDHYLFNTISGTGRYVRPNLTNPEVVAAQTVTSFAADGFNFGTSTSGNENGASYIAWNFKGGAGVFDIVQYTGNGTNRTIAHSLGVAPEFMFVRNRDFNSNWGTWHSGIAGSQYQLLNTNSAVDTAASVWNSTVPTSSVFSVGTDNGVNRSGDLIQAYLFASLANVSKVGTYTGNGTTRFIDCSLSSGAKFVMIKRINATGNWCIWDATRGMTSGTSPFLTSNGTTETATSGNVQTTAGGFTIGSTDTASINVNGGTYVFLAFA